MKNHRKPVPPLIPEEPEQVLVTHLHAGVDAHVLQERPLTHGSQTGHSPSCHPPQEAEVHVGGEVGRARIRQDVVEPVTFEPLRVKQKPGQFQNGQSSASEGDLELHRTRKVSVLVPSWP